MQGKYTIWQKYNYEIKYTFNLISLFIYLIQLGRLHLICKSFSEFALSMLLHVYTEKARLEHSVTCRIHMKVGNKRCAFSYTAFADLASQKIRTSQVTNTANNDT